MSHTAVFTPDNQNRSQEAEITGQMDVAVLEILERGRSEILQITNYLEALYARVLAETAGATALLVIAGETSSNPLQAA
ncbi:hypothetical protein J2Z31_002991 [Sinorhizobium kostiense]|uniref:Uncharacterized protein n=1 Tax=Sinorhizobium kostiense TaxID=76747 RepID=A0ABS4R3M0_9HYPH|nr:MULTISPECIES: hypothetical protein [Sinorhizobium]MBP2236477.1 hypothetical protein [Sinorhizobium kostiense]